MPYASNRDLPAAIRNALPAEGQTLWRTVYSAAGKEYGEDSPKAYATAWAALRKAGWKKAKDGTWSKPDTSKSADSSPVTLSGRVCKVDDERRLVFGWLYVSVEKDGSQPPDLQGDLIDPHELEAAAYSLILSGAGDADHDCVAKARFVESLAVTKEKLEYLGLPADALPQGHWIGLYVEDEATWARVKSGELAAFSMYGTGVRSPLEVAA